MRTKLLLFFIGSFIYQSLLFSQNTLSKDAHYLLGEVMSPVQKYQDEIESLRAKLNNDQNIIFNDKMLNILFSEKIGAIFQGSSDLSLQKFYVALDADDDSFAFGFNYATRGKDITKRMNFVISSGFKVKSEDKFSTFIENGEFEGNSINLLFKLAYVGRGVINYDSSKIDRDRKKEIMAHRSLLYDKYDEKVKEFNEKEDKDVSESIRLFTKTNSEFDDKYTGGIVKKSDELFIEMAKEEVKNIKSKKLYKSITTHWFSVDFNTPLGSSIYKVSPDENTAFNKEYFYPFEFNLSGTFYREYSAGMSWYILPRITYKNNNNILVNDLSTKAFQQINQGNGFQVVSQSDAVYVTDYNQFTTTTVKLEAAFFFFNNHVGFSPAVEFNGGEYKKTNWKLGIPISLKDKEGKPKINFEIQWKQQSSFIEVNHLVGISANFIFGQHIN